MQRGRAKTAAREADEIQGLVRGCMIVGAPEVNIVMMSEINEVNIMGELMTEDTTKRY